MSEKKKRILVVDDEEIVADIVKQMLEFEDYEVETTGDGETAISLYREAQEAGNPFSLVIMDMNIPAGMGGMEAIPRLQEIDPQVRALLTTGSEVEEYAESGFCGCVTKPFDMKSLYRAVEDALGV